jgi:hypothetical protein
MKAARIRGVTSLEITQIAPQALLARRRVYIRLG